MSMAYACAICGIGYSSFGIMGVLNLVAFTYLLWCINKRIRQGLNRRKCTLNMLKSVGCAGIVLFIQVASGYSMYYLIGLLSYPLVVILVLPAYLLIFIFLTASTALLFLPFLTRCRRCPQQSAPIVFLVLIALICGGFMALVSHALDRNWKTSCDAVKLFLVYLPLNTRIVRLN